MNEQIIRLPKLLSLPLRVVPNAVHSVALALILNRLFASRIKAGEMDFLRGKSLQVRITDTGTEYCLSLEACSFKASDQGDPDVIMSGTLYDFLVLASREEDPDTLFFNRRLRMEGDTAVGLELKNYLDSLDWEMPKNFPEFIRELPHRGVNLYSWLFGSRQVTDKQVRPSN